MTASYESTTSRLAQQELGACTLIQDLLPLYMDGEVSPSSRETIAEHLTRCERCAGFLAGARSVAPSCGARAPCAPAWPRKTSPPARRSIWASVGCAGWWSAGSARSLALACL